MSGTGQAGVLSAERFYDALAPAYDRDYAYPPSVTQRQAAGIARLVRPGRLLDLGCGTGRMLGPLSKLGFAPVGLDVSAAMLGQARGKQTSVPLVRADMTSALPFGNESFNAVICLHATVIHLTQAGQLAALAAQVLRVLRPGGWLVAEFPHPASYPQATNWQAFREQVSLRAVDKGRMEMALAGGPNTLIRPMALAGLDTWLHGFARVEVVSDLGQSRYHLHRGRTMVAMARKG